MTSKRRTSSQKDKDYHPDMSSDSAAEESDHDSTNEASRSGNGTARSGRTRGIIGETVCKRIRSCKHSDSTIYKLSA